MIYILDSGPGVINILKKNGVSIQKNDKWGFEPNSRYYYITTPFMQLPAIDLKSGDSFSPAPYIIYLGGNINRFIAEYKKELTAFNERISRANKRSYRVDGSGMG